MMKYWRIGLGLLGLGIFGAVFYTQVFLPKSTYATTQPLKQDFKVWVSGIGTLDAQFIYPLGFPVTGRLLGVYVDQGDRVTPNQLLAQLDDNELNAMLNEAKASLAKTKLETQSTQQEIKLNQEQHDLNVLTYERYKQMLVKGNISKEQFDQARSQMMQSKIALETAKTHLELTLLESQRVQKSLEVIYAKLALLKINSPVDGLVIERLAETGQTVGAAQPVLSILDTDSLWVKAYIDERISGTLAVGQPAKIQLRSLPNQILKGQVKRVDFQSDPVTLERVVYIGLDQPLQHAFLKEQAKVQILARTLEMATTLPNDTLSYYQGKQGIWLAQNGKAHFVPIEFLTSNANEFAFNAQLPANATVIMPDKRKKPLYNGASVYHD